MNYHVLHIYISIELYEYDKWHLSHGVNHACMAVHCITCIYNACFHDSCKLKIIGLVNSGMGKDGDTWSGEAWLPIYCESRRASER